MDVEEAVDHLVVKIIIEKWLNNKILLQNINPLVIHPTPITDMEGHVVEEDMVVVVVQVQGKEEDKAAIMGADIRMPLMDMDILAVDMEVVEANMIALLGQTKFE